MLLTAFTIACVGELALSSSDLAFPRARGDVGVGVRTYVGDWTRLGMHPERALQVCSWLGGGRRASPTLPRDQEEEKKCGVNCGARPENRITNTAGTGAAGDSGPRPEDLAHRGHTPELWFCCRAYDYNVVRVAFSRSESVTPTLEQTINADLDALEMAVRTLQRRRMHAHRNVLVTTTCIFGNPLLGKSPR